MLESENNWKHQILFKHLQEKTNCIKRCAKDLHDSDHTLSLKSSERVKEIEIHYEKN